MRTTAAFWLGEARHTTTEAQPAAMAASRCSAGVPRMKPAVSVFGQSG